MNFECKACLGNDFEIFIENPKDYEYQVRRNKISKILKCKNCNSYIQFPWPSSGELTSFYKKDYQNYAISKVPLLSKFISIYSSINANKFIRKYGYKKTILDFGCGQGDFLNSLYEKGVLNLYGFDPVKYNNPKNNISKIKYFHFLDDLKLSKIKFDVIRLNHVIEHLCEVDKTMNLLIDMLSKNGIIIGQTPNAEHYTSKLWRKYWGNMHYPYHTIIFSKEGLSYAANRWGSQLLDTKGTNLTNGWALSLENFLKDKFNHLNRGRTFFYSILILISIPISTLDHFFQPKGSSNFNYFIKSKTKK